MKFAKFNSISSLVEIWYSVDHIQHNSQKNVQMEIGSESLTMHPQSLALTLGGTVLKESDDLDILELSFDSKMNFEKHLRSVSIEQLFIGLTSWASPACVLPVNF